MIDKHRNQEDALPRLLSPDELAERHQCSTAHLANQRWRGTGVPYIKIGRRIGYRWSDVLAHEDANMVQTVPA